MSTETQKKIINARYQQKIDTSENWNKAVNFTPLNGELIVYSDLQQIKIGDGVTKVNDLPFISANGVDTSLITIEDIDAICGATISAINPAVEVF